MSEFFSDFLGFLIFSPLTAVVFGFGIWILPAVLLRNHIGRLRLRFFHFFVSGYFFIAIMTLYLLLAGESQDGGGRHHKAGPFVGMIASLALAWGINRFLRSRFPDLFDRLPRLGGRGGPAQPPTPGHPGAAHPGYPHPGYGHPGYGPGVPPAYPQHPGYQHPGYPGYPQPLPPSQAATPSEPQPGPPPQPRAPGVPWVVPPGQATAPPAPPTED